MKIPQRQILLAIAAFALAACGAKTVSWEEEAILNTGEIIWVKRDDSYGSGAAYSNPFKPAWKVRRRTIEFMWQSQRYRYSANEGEDAPMMIYALLDNQSVGLVVWTKRCAKPGYAAMRWMNGRWRMQPNMEPELIGRPRNLMGHFSAQDGAIPKRVSQQYKSARRFDLPQNGAEETNLNATRVAMDCATSERK